MGVANQIIRFKELEELESVSLQLLEIGQHIPVWLFQGHMGAGKTTLIKALCRTLGVEATVHSPTFSLVNEYLGADGQTIYHFDFYRIKDEVEALDIGIEEYFYSGSFCFVEWPSKVEGLWPEHYLLIDLQMDDRGERVLAAEEVGKS